MPIHASKWFIAAARHRRHPKKELQRMLYSHMLIYMDWPIRNAQATIISKNNLSKDKGIDHINHINHSSKCRPNKAKGISKD